MSDEVLRLQGVEVRRDAAVLLRNVDWTAHGDERWIMIGPNGAGKTTLLQVAATLMFPTASVYGKSRSPSLRLITCGGPFDQATGHYVDNIIVYAHLVAG